MTQVSMSKNRSNFKRYLLSTTSVVCVATSGIVAVSYYHDVPTENVSQRNSEKVQMNAEYSLAFAKEKKYVKSFKATFSTRDFSKKGMEDLSEVTAVNPPRITIPLGNVYNHQQQQFIEDETILDFSTEHIIETNSISRIKIPLRSVKSSSIGSELA